MEPTREKLQQFYRRPPGMRQSRHCFSPHGIFRPPKLQSLQKTALKWRKDHLYRGKRKVPYRKHEETHKKTPEEAEEEERRKKLTDTANKLLSKIKTWNAENSNPGKSEEEPQKGEESSPCDKSDPKPRRIAHSKSQNSVKKVKKKSAPKSATATQYDVNKDTLKDFQNRIQHKLIEDIMQMPKENLQNVLNDPKINPIMEVKMTSLVRENKPLIAKKLRALAEAKMKSTGSSEILVDFDKLIDPVIETDLSVLPYELIKEMEKVFQVQFDYSPQGVDSVRHNAIPCENLESVQENTEDLNAYECSTDEDDQVTSEEVKLPLIDPLDLLLEQGLISDMEETEPSNVSKSLSENVTHPRESKTLVTAQCQTESCLKESTASQTYHKTENTSTQTGPGFLYGVPLPVEAKDNTFSSLMEEVNSIQNLINKLNEKRFLLFLELARMNPNGNFNFLENKNFIETVSNGSISLFESLTRFFRVRNFEQNHSNPRNNRQRYYHRQERRK